MSPVDLPVRYHRQDDSIYCGPACAQMVIHSLGAPLPLLDQADLYKCCNGHSSQDGGTWATGPDGLLWTLNNRRPPGCTKSFTLYELDSPDAVSRAIVWSIHQHQVAAVALVRRDPLHWIVVRGFDTTALPTSLGDPSYAINGFMINNPFPDGGLPQPPLPPHDDDDYCGTNVVGPWGWSDQHISYSTWISDYMLGVKEGHWNGKYLAVAAADSSPLPQGSGQIAAPQAFRAESGLLSPAGAGELAVEGLKRNGLHEHAGWKASLKKAVPGDGILVQRLDRIGSFYYIVPMRAGRTKAPILTCVDAQFGTYRQSVHSPSRGAKALAGLQRASAEVFVGLNGKKVQLGGYKGNISVCAHGACQYPTLVWKPCRESLSPYCPFHMTVVGDHRIYTRIDGQVFTELHGNDKGI